MSSREATVTDNLSAEPKAKAAKVTEEADTCSDGFGMDLPDEACSFVELPSEPLNRSPSHQMRRNAPTA